MFRKEVAAEEVVNKAPQHCRDQEQYEIYMPPLPGTAINRSSQKRYISKSGNQGK